MESAQTHRLLPRSKGERGEAEGKCPSRHALQTLLAMPKMSSCTHDDLAQRVRQFCSAHALKLNTNLGQHFLIDASILDAIVSSATIRSDDAILEIGPGIGILTEQLLKKAARVTAIELDERLLPLLD